MKRVILTLVVTILVLLAIPFLIFATGMLNVAASNDPGSFEESIATFAVERSVAVRAPDATSPLVDAPHASAAGLNHYASMCVRCHGRSGVQAEEFARGLHPPAPKLDHAAQNFTAGELFWITTHGIRMTGMPAFGATHEDDDIWKIVAFVRQLGDLNEDQANELQEVASHQHHHGEGGSHMHEHGSSSPSSASSSGHEEQHVHSGHQNNSNGTSHASEPGPEENES